MAIIGIDISSNRVSVAEVAKKRNVFLINNAAVFDLPEHVVQKGEIKDTKIFSQSLRDIWKYYRFSSHKVFIGITNPKVIVKEISMPVTESSEIESSIKYQINDLVPISKDNISYDYIVLEKGDNFSRVMIAGAAKNIINNIIESLRLAKLNPVVMDLNCFSLFRLINNYYHFPEKKDNAAYCLINIGKNNTIISMIVNNEIKFPRFSNIGIGTFIDNISKDLNINYSRAEDLLYNFDFNTAFDVKFDKDSEFSIDNDYSKDISGIDVQKNMAIRNIADQFINEISRSIDFFLQENQNYNINKIILSGDMIKNFEKYFINETNFDTEYFDIQDNFDIRNLRKLKAYREKDLNMLANHLTLAIGMAFRGYKL